MARQLTLGGMPEPEALDTAPLPTRAEALALVAAGAYDPPEGVHYELDAWVLVSSVTTEGVRSSGRKREAAQIGAPGH